MLGAGKWEITCSSQVPSDHICKSPPGFRLAPKPSCSQQWKSWFLPRLRNTGLGNSWREGCKARGVCVNGLGDKSQGFVPVGRGSEPTALGDLGHPPTLQKFDYDSSTVRKKFFREALLQITIPFLLKKLAPTCKGVRGAGLGCREGLSTPVEGLEHPFPPSCRAEPPLPWQELAKFQELIFEDFASFILVENTYEEVVLQSVMKDIMQGRLLCEEVVTSCRVLGAV